MSVTTRLDGPLLRTERQEGGKRKLLRPLKILAAGKHHMAPEGMMTDFTSIPWIGGMLLHWTRVDVAGVIHDHLYQDQPVSRGEADRVWRLVARAGKRRAMWHQAWGGWLGLRLLGWIVWNRHARAKLRDAEGTPR